METETENVLKINKKLNKIIARDDDAQIEKAHKQLNKLVPLEINLKILEETHIGITVNNLRKKSQDTQLKDLCASLMIKWKKTVEEEDAKEYEKKKEKGKEYEKKKEKGKENESKQSNKRKIEEAEDDEDAAALAAAKKLRNSSNLFDPIRVKSREMLFTALKSGEGLDGSRDREDLAIELEEAIYTELQNTDFKYKNRIRSRVSNLRDSKNPELIRNFMCGALSAQKLAKMTADEMASDDMKKLREEFLKEGINNAQLATVQGTKTDLLKCNKCKKKNCTYNQLQTRSSDEPMTTFVMCNECGNRWKFC